MSLFNYTTPTLTFSGFPYSEENCTEVYLTFVQSKRIVLDIEKENITFGDNCISVRLTQEQTSKFRGGIPIFVQIRVLLVNGTATASNIMEVPIKSVLKQEVIS